MLRLRPEQMNEFEEISRARFIEKICRTIRGQHGDLAGHLSDDELRMFMAKALDVAQSHQLVVEADVYEFSVLHLLFGADWLGKPEYRWAQNFLNDLSQSPDGRLFQIREHLRLQAEKATQT